MSTGPVASDAEGSANNTFGNHPGIRQDGFRSLAG
jgi:hypothetical protein